MNERKTVRVRLLKLTQRDCLKRRYLTLLDFVQLLESSTLTPAG